MSTDFNTLKILMDGWNATNEYPLKPEELEKIVSDTMRYRPGVVIETGSKAEIGSSLVPFDKLIERSMEELDATDANECISTGYKWLDDQIVGLFKSELMVVGGETGTGKTTFVTNICYQASRRGIKTAVFALEDRLTDYGIRAVYFELGKIRKKYGNAANYPWNAYRKNEIKDPSYKAFRKKAQDNLKNDNLFFVDVPSQMNISALEKMVTEFTQKGVKLFLVDHLHYFDMMREDKSKADYIEETMIRLKTLMNRTGARVILVVHYKKLDGKKPTVDSFKDSIAIPQNANYIINIWRDRSETGNRLETKFFMPKVRNPNGERTITLKYDADSNEYIDELETSFGSPQDNMQSLAQQIDL